MSDNTIQPVEIWASQVDPESLQRVVKSVCADGFSIHPLPPRAPRFRSAETAPVLVGAIIGFSGPLIAEVIKGLWGLLKEKRAQRIVIRDGDTSLELPADLISEGDMAKLTALLERIKNMSAPKIMV